MKFTVDIDLDWIGEDSSIDDEVKNQIIGSIESKVLKTLEGKVMEAAQSRIESQVSVLIRDTVTAKVEQLMTVPRTATDSYGRVVKENFTIEQLLIEAVDAAVTKKTLDQNGRVANGYDQKYTQFEYFATKDIPSLVDKKVKELGESVKKDIEQLITQKIKMQVADKLTAMIVENSTSLSLKA